MNLKERLVRSLIKLGKKNKLLVYPTLALIAVVTAVSNVIGWGKGNGKKLVAGMMVFALLITQSLVLTSSANDPDPAPEAEVSAEVPDATPVEYTLDPEDPTVILDYVEPAETDPTVISDEAELDPTVITPEDILDLDNELASEIDETVITEEEIKEETKKNGKKIVTAEGEDGETIYIEEAEAINAPGDECKVILYVNGEKTTIELDRTVDHVASPESYKVTLSDSSSATAFNNACTFLGIEAAEKEYFKLDTAPNGSFLYKDSTLQNGVASGVVYENSTAPGEIPVYCSVSRTKYTVKVEDSSVPEEEGLSISNGSSEATCNTPQSLNSDGAWTVPEIGTAGFGCYRRGYDYTGVQYGSASLVAGHSTTVSNTTNVISVAPTWQPKTGLQITYHVFNETDKAKIAVNPEGQDVVESNLTYGQNVTLKSYSDVQSYSKNEAYYLVGWMIDGTSIVLKPQDGPVALTIASKLAKVKGEVGDAVNVEGVSLTGVWDYKKLSLNTSNTANITINDTTKTDAVVTLTYGDSADFSITGKYSYDGYESDKVTFKINQTDATKLANDYGISVAPGGDNSIRITQTAKSITGENGIVVRVDADDPNRSLGDTMITPCTITVKINPRPVTLDDSTITNASNDNAPSKTYDGTNIIGVKPEAGVIGAATVNSDVVKVLFDSAAEAEKSDAGSPYDLTLRNVHLSATATGGVDISDYYVLADERYNAGSLTVNDIASITKAPVHVKVDLAEGENGNIKFGMDTPKFTVTLTDKTEIAALERDAYDTDPESFMTNNLGMKPANQWDDTRPSVYSPAGTYKVTPTFNSGNYDVIVNNQGQYTVTRDPSEENTTYTIEETPVGGYYAKLTVAPTGNYDRIVKVSADVSPASTRAAAEAGASNQVVVTENMIDETLYFLVFNSNDHSMAELITLEHINIDTDQPILDSYAVTPSRSYFFDPTIKFGGYYRSQSIAGSRVDGVTFDLVYHTNGSAVKEIRYYFVDATGSNTSGSHVVVNKITPLGSNRYSGSFTIGSGTVGQLIVYAVDDQDRPSALTKLKLNSADGQQAENAGKNPAEYYEWIIENTIASATITATDQDGNVAVPSTAAAPVWYRAVNFTAAAADDGSGLNSIQWTVEKPDGTAVTSSEKAGDSLANITGMTAFGAANDKTMTKITGYNFVTGATGNPVGTYYASAKLYDNSGNEAVLDRVGPYMVDGIAPRVDLGAEGDSTEFSSDYEFEFTVTEPAEESGVKTVSLYRSSISGEPLKTWGSVDKYSYTITENGTYIVVAEDIAGNVTTEARSFGKISTVVPDTPKIIVSTQDGGRIGSAGWYIVKEPLITIESSAKTSDGLPVTTIYKVEGEGNKYSDTFTSAKREFVLGDDTNDKSDWENEVKISAYATTSANSSKTVATSFKVDTKIPVVEITSSVVNNGAVTVNFKVTDEISGVDTTKVYVNGQPVTVSEQDGLVTGSFTASGASNYSIYAYDIAGNVSEKVSFSPMVLDAYPVTNITTSSADISAYVHKGSAELDPTNCYIEYKKASAGSYLQALNTKETLDNGDIALSATFNGLRADTVYDYRIHAKTKTSNEELIKTGRFRTNGYENETTIQGTASYSVSADQNYPIYVNLYEGNTIIAGAKVTDSDNPNYVFKNIADGDYRVSASDGILSDEASVTVQDGTVTYPETYSSTGGVNLVLKGGMSTAVEIDDDDVLLSVDGLDKIYNTDLYRGNVTTDDLAVVANGGRIVITLHAKTVNVTGIEKSVLEQGIGKRGEIVKYIQLYVIKEVFDENGNYTNFTPRELDHLAEPLRITIGLEDLAGQRIKVASLHGSGEEGYTFMDGEDYESVELTDRYISICTNMFSVYALYRESDAPDEYTVKWLDGDGNVMKTEKVTDGSSATPPTATPTKTATERYSYQFARWDRSYDKITADTSIQALFVAHKKTVTWIDGDGNIMKSVAAGDKGANEAPEKTPTKKATSKYTYTFTGWKKSVDKNNGDIIYQALFQAKEKKPGTTENPTTENPTTETPTTETPTTESPSTAKPAEVDPQKKAKETTPVYSYMNTGSPATGDEAPIAAVTVLMLLAGVGIVVICKKRKKDI